MLVKTFLFLIAILFEMLPITCFGLHIVRFTCQLECSLNLSLHASILIEAYP